MVFRDLYQYKPIANNEGVPHYEDHFLFYAKVEIPVIFDEHFTGLGIISNWEGKSKLVINGIHSTINTDEFFIVNQGSTLSIQTSSKGCELVMLFFNTTLSELLTQSFFQQNIDSGKQSVNTKGFSLVEHIHFRNISLREHLSLLISLGNSCASFGALKSDMVIRSLLEDLIQENYTAYQVSSKLKVIKDSTKVDLYKKLTVAKQWMERNFQSNISLKQAAEIAMLNEHHFLRLFKQAFHTTPHRFLTQLRLDHAMTLLEDPTLSVSEICEQVGFESVSSFSHLFKQYKNISPGQYRKAAKK